MTTKTHAHLSADSALLQKLADMIERDQCGDVWDINDVSEADHARLPELLRRALPQTAPVTRGPDCACCEQQPRKDCTVPGCAMKHAEWALPAPQAVAWRTDIENAPSEAYDFFLVRPQGNHPGRGGPFHPTIVQRIDGKFYTSDNELDPIYFGQDEPDDSPMKTTLEWKPLPADWLTTSTLTRPQRGTE
jgi:hypothetical protein